MSENERINYDPNDPRVIWALKRRQRAHAGLRAHWISFISVNAFLFLLNFLIGYRYPWHLFPLLAWGVGLGIHSAVVFITDNHPRGPKRGFLVHAAVFVVVNLFFLGINMLTWPYYLWFWWIAASWGIGLGEHFVAYNANRRKAAGHPVSRYYILWYPGVVCLYLVFVDFFTGWGLTWFWWPTLPIMGISLAIIAGIESNARSPAPYHQQRRQQLPVVNAPVTDSRRGLYAPNLSRESSPGKFCPKCGEEISGDHAFCEYCGLKLR
jgi:hypothetical protein